MGGWAPGRRHQHPPLPAAGPPGPPCPAHSVLSCSGQGHIFPWSHSSGGHGGRGVPEGPTRARGRPSAAQLLHPRPCVTQEVPGGFTGLHRTLSANLVSRPHWGPLRRPGAQGPSLDVHGHVGHGSLGAAARTAGLLRGWVLAHHIVPWGRVHWPPHPHAVAAPRTHTTWG